MKIHHRAAKSGTYTAIYHYYQSWFTYYAAVQLKFNFYYLFLVPPPYVCTAPRVYMECPRLYGTKGFLIEVIFCGQNV